MPDALAAVLAVEQSLEVLAERDLELKSFASYDVRLALEAGRHATEGPLFGTTLGVKDNFDTVDLPTEYGSSIYRGHRPRADAAAVAMLLDAGATMIGKTATTEFAWFTPAATTNPHRASHTPGGSSSGSAAAVAAGIVDLALGTQTAGSVIRPASFCGIFGYKPTFGLAPTAGVKQAAPSLDTVGMFARDLDLLDVARVVLTGRRDAGLGRPLRVALLRTPQWTRISDDAKEVIESAAAALGATLADEPEELSGLAEAHEAIQAYEGARALAFEWRNHRAELSEGLCRILEAGWRVDSSEYDQLVAHAHRTRDPRALGRLFAGADVLVTPAATGEAPEGLGYTGDPRCSRAWTLLGLPCLSVPGFLGETGMPIGVQLVARPRCDAHLFAVGRALLATSRS